MPRFVLGELQYIADSEDPLKKARGARGLDILEKLQKEKNIEVQISDNDFPDIHQVDMKLISFAQKHKARILTNDVNLNKIANLRGVPVLNLNSLANSLKPVVLPGEGMAITVIKEGREDGQGRRVSRRRDDGRRGQRERLTGENRGYRRDKHPPDNHREDDIREDERPEKGRLEGKGRAKLIYVPKDKPPNRLLKNPWRYFRLFKKLRLQGVKE